MCGLIDFFDTQNLAQENFNSRNGKVFSIMNLNVQSILNKVDQLNLQVVEHNIDIICLTETWLRENQLNYIGLSNYKIGGQYCRKINKHGGIILATRENWKVTTLDKIKDLSIEKDAEFAGMYITNINTVVVGVYRSPTGTMDVFLRQFTEVLLFLAENFGNQRIIVSGDFNINFMLDNKESKSVMNLCDSFGVKGKFFEASRISKTTKTCIDNIFTNCVSSHSTTKELHVSDHQAQILTFPASEVEPEIKKKIIQRDITQVDTDMLKKDLSQMSWERFFEQKNAVESFSSFHEHFMNILNIRMPVRETEVKINKRKKQIWKTPKIEEMKKNLDALYTVAISMGDDSTFRVYKSYKDEYRKEINKTIREKNEEFVKRADNKQKALWKVIRSKNSKNKKVEINEQLQAEELNEHFASIGKKISEKLFTTQEPVEVAQNVPKNNEKSCFFFDCTENEVKKIITSMKSKKTADIYDVTTEILKSLCEEIANPISLMVNKCLREGYFPDELKLAKIIPVYKGKGDKKSCDNYRPISILPCLSKIFESIIKNRMLKWLQKHKLLNENQHGFRKGRSTTTALMNAINEVIDGMDNGEYMQMLNFDLSKAFDSVSHTILLKKLYAHGFRGTVLRLLESYLKNRSQKVFLNGVSSTEHAVEYGVPQGSVLGPILFIIYINDITIKHCNCLCLYCDDTSIIVKSKNKDELSHRTELAIEEVKTWFAANSLKLNADKTVKLEYGGKQSQASAKFLGVVLDNRLNWAAHIDYICDRLAKSLYLLRELRKCGTYEMCRTAYFANFQSVLLYGILLWGNASDAVRVFILQKKAMRIMHEMGSRDSCRTVFKKYGILTFPSLYIRECLLYIQRGGANLRKNGTYHMINTRHRDDLRTPLHRRKNTQNSAAYYWSAKMFNKIPNDMKNLPERAFRKVINRLLIANEFYSVEEFFSFQF